jgi:hypothetical protein
MPHLKLRPRDIQAYRACDLLSELLIYFLLLFGPWAFGTTQPWSIWTMNATGYALGILLFLKLSIRRLKGYRPPRWEFPLPDNPHGKGPAVARALTVALACLSVALTAWCLVSALNARATWRPHLLSFDYHDCLPWLPHSLDSAKSWPTFWMCLGLACAFWALRDWILGKTDLEARLALGRESKPGTPEAYFLPGRLRRLFWLLAVNGGLLAVEGIAQRLEGSGKLLFLVRPRVNPDAVTQFGPWAYRSNASQYFNLLWPVCVGFWWTLQLSHGRRWQHYLLLVCAALMAACPIISSSRGGAMVTVGIVGLAAFLLVSLHLLLRARKAQETRARRLSLAVLLICFASALALGLGLGWKNLAPRMREVQAGFDGRDELSERALPMAADYPWFGTGPGTFETVFQLYRASVDSYWPAQLHNDWLETRITFGWLGSSLLWLSLLLVLARWFFPGDIHGGRRFMVLAWLAIAGCLVHARYDFPFQIHSIVALFLTLCAVLSVLSRR